MHESVEVKLVSSAVPARLAAVQRFEGDDELGKPFRFEALLVTAAGETLEQDALLSAPVSVEFLRGGVVENTLHGAVWSVRSSLASDTGHLMYRLEIGPRFRRLALSSGSEVFLDQSVVEIVAQKLTRAGLVPGADFELRLVGAYPPRDLTMQYNETDLAFVSRLCEHWGIAISFEHASGRDVVVFTDENMAMSPIPTREGADHVLAVRRGGELGGLYELDATTRTLPSAYVVDDYNYRTPAVPLMSAGPIPSGTTGVLSEFGPHAKTPAEAALFATIRAQEIGVSRHVLEGTADDTRLRAGCRTRIVGHPSEDGEIVVTAVHHEIEQAVFGRDVGDRKYLGDRKSYRARFQAIRASTPFRPERRTPKPKIHGVIPANIESAGGTQYADPDGDGRYHVRFKLDHGAAPMGHASKLVRMQQPHVGAGYGFHMPLRSGVEVMASFLDGDPDRPLISGAVPNPTTPSVVNARNAKRNVMRFGGGSEINVDDQEGSTRIKMTVPYGKSIFQIGAPNAPVEGFYFFTEKDYVAEIRRLVRFEVGDVEDHAKQPPGSFTVVAETKVSMTAEKEAMSLTARDDSIHARAGSDVTVDAGGDVATTAGSNISSKAGSAISEQAGSSISSNAGSSISLTAGSSVAVTASGSTMTLDAASSITAGAPAITLNGAATIDENAPKITVTAGAELTQSAPTVKTTGTTITVSSTGVTTVTGQGLLGLGSSSAINAEAPIVDVKGTTIAIEGTSITITAPVLVVSSANVMVSSSVVTVSGESQVSVKGGEVEVDGESLVNVHGAMIKLNC
ncbi:MAG TPA: type VI secretion system tip protein TssI/VgrG [Minicystis sp.]|nr:type VI secretion system tip protein TssI/VgrG [Minicystis sp.]